MRIIMFGTGPFAVPTFQSLLASDHDVPLLVTRPIADSGKRRKSAENPTRDAGEQAGIEIFDPDSINEPAAIEQLRSYAADLFVVCDYGQLLSPECLGLAKLGGINLHGSLLPKYRGAAPINWAIYHGEEVTGITVIHMSPKLDAGNCLTTAEMNIDDHSAESIEPHLAELGVEPVHRAIDMLEHWDGESPIGTPQDRSLATRAPRLNKKDGRIDWSRSAEQVLRHIRAFRPWPGTFSEWIPENKKPLRLIIHDGSPVELATLESENVEVLNDCEPGTVALASSEKLVIQTGDIGFSIDKIQPAGKRVMEISEFLRGYKPSGKLV